MELKEIVAGAISGDKAEVDAAKTAFKEHLTRRRDEILTEGKEFVKQSIFKK